MRKVVAAAVACLFFFACASKMEVIPTPTPTLDALPDAPIGEVQPEKNWVVSVEKPEDVGERKGILMSEEKAALLAKYRVAYPGLRKWAELEQALWSGKWAVTQRLLLESEQQRENDKPGWWERNDFEIGVATGIVLGALATIAIVYGVQEVKQ